MGIEKAIIAQAHNSPTTIPPDAESWPAEAVLRWAFDGYRTGIAVASAFGPEGLVVLDLASKIVTDIPVFMLDTGYLFPETLELVTKVERRYRIRVERISRALTPEMQAARYGPDLWLRNPDQCCQLRKIEPLKSKLKGLQAWITAIRRDQTQTRESAKKIHWDHQFNLMKINPLVDWTRERVWTYIREHHLDYNSLHDQQYPSIGCMPCTRAVREDEGERAGRWSGFAKSECGLHGLNHGTTGPDTVRPFPPKS
jgi:phosphoadenosine phosphosulfate reductase